MKDLWELLELCKYTTAGNKSHCASDFWIFYYKHLTYYTFNGKHENKIQALPLFHTDSIRATAV